MSCRRDISEKRRTDRNTIRIGSCAATFYFLLSTFYFISFAAAGPVLPHVVQSSIDLYPYGNGACHNVTFWKNTVYVSSDGTGCGSATLFAVDASNPANLTYLARGGFGGCKANDLKVVEDVLYVAAWSDMLRVLDVSNRNAINLLWAYQPGFPASWGLDVYNQRAFVTVADASYPNSEGMRIIDVSNPHPSNPNKTLIAPLYMDSYNIGGLAVRGSYAFIADGQDFEVANISDEKNPSIIATRPMPNLLVNVCLRDQYAYVSSDKSATGLVIFDISNPTNPLQVGQYTGGSGHTSLLGDYAFMAGYGDRLRTVDISVPTSPHAVADTNLDSYSDAVFVHEDSVTGNNQNVYVGTLEMYQPPGQNNYFVGKVYSLKVLDADPDNAGPGKWSNFTPSEASWDTQYEGDVLPTLSSPSWQVFEGSESWAGSSNGVLRINDSGSGANDKVRWWRSWDATNTRGATVLIRAQCASYDPAGSPVSFYNNLTIEDGKYAEDFSFLSDKIRAVRSNLQFNLDGTQWHTYRITTQGAQFNIYIDEAASPAFTGPLSSGTNRARVMFGTGSGNTKQDLFVDYLNCYSNGVYGPALVIPSLSPNISVNVADTAGKDSLSGINPASARVSWSSDGGATWNSSGGALWDVQYEGNALPSASTPAWTIPEGTEVWASIDTGVLRVNDTSTASNTKIKWARAWSTSPGVGNTVVTRARCASAGDDTSLLGNIFVEDGVRRAQFKIMPDHIEEALTGLTYALDGTQWHVYRFTSKNFQFKVYVDEAPSPVMVGSMNTTTTANRVMFGSGASAGTQDIYFDYVRYASHAELPPGQGDGGGSVVVTCTGQNGDDRGFMNAYAVPFTQYSDTLNQVRFFLRDMAGNVGTSPIYNVRITQAGPFPPVSNFAATPGLGKITLTWTNPADARFTATLVRYRTDTYPTGPADGTQLVDQAGTAGSNATAVHTPVTRGVTYYYAAFAHEGTPYYATGATAAATAPSPGDLDFDGDVDQSDFGMMQDCYTPSGASATPDCLNADLNFDNVINVNDFTVFLGCMGGPNKPPGC